MSPDLGARSAETLRNTYMLGQRGLQALLEGAGETGELNGGLSAATLALGKSRGDPELGPTGAPRSARDPAEGR